MAFLDNMAESPIYQRIMSIVDNLKGGGTGKKKRVKGLCAFSIKTNGLSFAYGYWAGDQFHLSVVDFVELEDTNRWFPALAKLIKEHKLEGVHVNWVLQPHEYKLLQMQDVNVPDEELRLAVRWRIKDLIDFSIEDAVVDAFKIPAHGPGNRRKMLYVTVAKQGYIKSTVEKINELGVTVSIVDVNYLALRNVTRLYEKPEKSGIMLLHMQATEGEALITKDGYIFLARQIDKGLNTLLKSDEQQRFRVESLAMEVKRSFDYYITQMAQPEPGTFLLSPLQLTGTLVSESLQRNFDFPIELLDLNKKLTTDQPIAAEVQSACLSAIGGAMRKELDVPKPAKPAKETKEHVAEKIEEPKEQPIEKPIESSDDDIKLADDKDKLS